MGTINLIGTNLKSFVKDVYDLSRPQGMGHLHFTPGPLSDEEAEAIIKNWEGNERVAVSMDYVHGRACKMTVFRDAETGALSIHDRWYDHTPRDLQLLLERHGIVIEQEA